MTLDEISDLCKKLLERYEPELRGKVRGKMQYDKSAKIIERETVGRPDSHPEREVEEAILGVLDELVQLKDGFIMSQSLPVEKAQDRVPVRYKTLELVVAKVWNYNEGTARVRVKCGYYPA